MDVLYQGFDGLDLSFVGQISDRLSEALEAAKQSAQETRRPSLLEWPSVRMLVFESGARGGYAFMSSTGPFGATWFFKRRNARDPWGVRVSCNSFNLATLGLGGARAELYRTLELLEISVNEGAETIGRVDYAVDLLAPQFALDPQFFVMHSNSSRSDHIEHTEITSNGRSGRVTSVTVGKMPGRQVIIYDKRAEVIAKNKAGWWVIWNAARAHDGLAPLNPEVAAESRVWRVELRAGKSHLRDRWAIRTWAELDSHFGDMIAASLRATRYAQPNGDTNRSRWPDSEIWKLVKLQADADLFEMRLWADPDLVKRVEREAHDRLLAGQMLGLLTTRAALSGIDAGNLVSFAMTAGEEMSRKIAESPSRYEKKLARAGSRYSLGPIL